MKRVGVGTRALNFVVDSGLIFLLTYASFRTWNWYVVYWHYQYFNFWCFFAAILFIYYTVFESISGRTPGKWLSYSKAVDNNGRKPNFVKVIIRSLIRLTVIDMFFLPFLEKPLHDYVSRTEVVEI